jgi:PKD repeat protein
MKRFNRSLLAALVACLCIVTVLVSASPSLVLDDAYLQSSLHTDFVVAESASSSSCFMPRCLTPDSVNQRRLLRFGLRVQNVGDASASIELEPGLATVAQESCTSATSILQLVTLLVTDSSNATLASGTRDLCLFDQETTTGYSGGGSVSSTAVFTSCRTPASPYPLQGLSAGWQMTYTSDINCMYLDITGLAAGSYTFQATINEFNGSPAHTSTASFTISAEESCPPVTNYADPVLSNITASQWIDPHANGHVSISLPTTAGDFSDPISVGAEPWIFGCTGFTSFAVDVGSRLSFASRGSGVAVDTKIDFTIAAFNAAFLNGTAYYHLTGSSPSRVLLVSWVDVVANENATHLAWQAQISEDGDVVFRYRNVSYQTSGGQDAGEGRQQNVYLCGGGSSTATNCVVYAEQAASFGGAYVSDNSALAFARRPPGFGSSPPNVVMGNTPSGSSFEAGTTLTFNATTSAVSATLGWSFGDGFQIEQIADTVSHDFTTAGEYTVRLTAFDGTYYVVSTKSITITEPQSQENWSSSDTLAVCLGIFIPITVIIVVVVVVAAIIFLFFGRRIVPSGGSWWNKDPAYVNTEAPTAGIQ